MSSADKELLKNHHNKSMPNLLPSTCKPNSAPEKKPIVPSNILWKRNTQINPPVVSMIKPVAQDDKMDHKKSLINQGTIRELTVARFGRIYKRKAPSKMGYLCIQPMEGYRFCKFCNANLPLTAFYATTKRYVCRRHHYKRVIENVIKRKKEDPYWILAKTAWLKINSKRFYYGYDKIRYDIGDVRNIFLALKDIIPIYDILPVCVPIDCNQPMRVANNVAVISSRAFYFLIKLYAFVPYRSIYIAFVQRMNLAPRNFDVGCPMNPFHDPNFCRVDINVADIFAEEQKRDPVFTGWTPSTLAKALVESQDHDVIAEFLNDHKVPWLDCERLPPGEAGLWLDGKPKK